MRPWIAIIAISVLSLSLVSCTVPKISITITIGSQGKASVTNEKTFSALSISDAVSNSSDSANSLVDTDSTLTFDSTTPAQALITVTTDTGQTFAQSFPIVPTNASAFAPAASGTVTNAFAAQNPSAVSTFIQSAASHANSTLSVDVQTKTTFQGPMDGNSHTVIGRQYTPSQGVTAIGSAAYTAPLESNCGSGSGGFTEKQLCF